MSEPPPPTLPRPRVWPLLLVALLAFALRVGVAEKFQGLSAPPDGESNPDQLDYELFAWRVASGDGYTLADGSATARRPPGTSAALLPVYALLGRDFAAGRLWFAALSAASCLVAGLIARDLFGGKAGVLAALTAAFLPGHFYYSMHFLSEVPYGLAIALACWLGLRAVRRADEGRAWLPAALCAGLCFGAALLTRPQVAFAGGLVLLGAFLSPRERRGARVQLVVVAGLAAALLLLPWVARNQLVMGKATLSTIGGVTFWGANNSVIAHDPAAIGGWMPVDTLIDAAHPLAGSEPENDSAAWRYGFEWLKSDEADLPRLLAMKLARHFSPFRPTPNRAVYWSFALSWLAVAPVALAGFALAWRRARAATVVLLAPIASTVLTALVFYGSIRFRDADASLYVVPAGALLASLLDALVGAWRRRKGPTAA